MYWPSMIVQPSAVPAVVLAVSVDMHSTLLVAGVLVLIAAMTLGLGILGLATCD